MKSDRRTDYELIAPRYDEDRAAWEIPPDEVIPDLLEELDVVSALDLGCGTGKYLEAQEHHLAGRPVRFAGVDPSAAMLGVAGPKLNNARLVQGRAEEIPFADGSFDYVHTSFAFHHFADKDAALHEIARLLGPQGVFRMVNVWLHRRWWGYLFFEGAWEIDEARFWPVERIEETLRGLSFEVTHSIDVYESSRSVREILTDAERRVSSQIAILDDRRYAEGLERIRAALLEDPNATVETASARLELTASRI